MRILGTGTAIVSRSDADQGSMGTPAAGGAWLRPMQNRRRRGLFVGPYQPTVNTPGSRQYYGTPDRFLTNDELWEVYRRTPDVRAAVDSIVRRVATFDWSIEPAVDPSSPKYEAAAEAAEASRRFLSAPSKDGATWQEVFTALLTDLLVYDAAALELVRNADGDLVEVNPLRGSSIDPRINDHGRVLYYEQSIYNSASAGVQLDTTPSKDDPTFSTVKFEPDDLIYLRLFPTTTSPVGNPLIEALVTEVISLLRSSEHTMLALDADEIPPGILVLAGLAGQAARQATADLQQLRGQDHKVRVLTTPDPAGIGARWVELRHTPKDLSFVEVVDQIRRTCWRVFGVLPVEMGATDGVNRATAEVQIDVASSHLVTPILELLAAKVNSRLLPLVVGDPDVAPLVRFQFDRERRLTPEQSRVIADRHARYIDAGVLTRNEARAELGLLPINGGDVPTVATGAGPVPLTVLVPTDGPTDEPPPDDSTPPPGDVEPEPEPDPSPSAAEEEGVEDAEAAEPNAEDTAPGEVEADDGGLLRAKIDEVPKRVAKILREKAKQHNEEVGDAKTKRTTPNTLAEVYDRGVGAYGNNPASVRPSVSSAQQWALARVNSFLYVLREGRFRGGKHDTDLLPKGHPLSTKGEKSRGDRSAIDSRAVVDLARLPIADDLMVGWGWEGGEAEKVLGDPPDWDRYARAHLWRDPSRASSPAGYKFPVARMIDGRLTLVFRGVASVVGALLEDGKHESLDGVTVAEQREVYRLVRSLYRRFGQEPPTIDRLEPDDRAFAAAERAVGDVDPTNFPKQGDDLKVSLRNSAYEVFDPAFAEMVRTQYPEVWGRGGNILGDKQYRRLRPVVARGGKVETETEELAVRLREAWSARHFDDFRLPGVIAQIKWYTVGKLGEAEMKQVVREAIDRLEDRSASPCSCGTDHHHPHDRALDHAPDCSSRDAARERSKILPSEWLPGGLFDDVRTLDLEAVGEQVSRYIDDVTDHWRDARDEVVRAVAYAGRGVSAREERVARAQRVLGQALDRLAVQWTVSTRPRYNRAAEIGSTASYTYSGFDSTDSADEFASSYAAEQIGYLTTSDGLLADVRLRVLASLQVLSDVAERSEVEIPATDGAPVTAAARAEQAAAAIALTEAAFDANEHRIAAYAGRLVEVSNGTMVLGLEQASAAVPGPPTAPETGAGPREATNWYAEWVATLDSRTCPVCSDEGQKPIRPLSSIAVRPGGGTPCGGRCRCVLVLWTEQEVRSGEALRIGPFD